jgi:hypothetical protein
MPAPDEYWRPDSEKQQLLLVVEVAKTAVSDSPGALNVINGTLLNTECYSEQHTIESHSYPVFPFSHCALHVIQGRC